MHPAFAIYFTAHNLFFSVLAVIIYVAFLAFLRRRRAEALLLRKLSHRHNNEQAQLSYIAQGLVLAYVIFAVIPEILAITCSNIQNGRYLPRVVLYASILKSAGTLMDFAVLLLKCGEFKKTLLRWIKKEVRESNSDQVLQFLKYNCTESGNTVDESEVLR